MNEKIQKARDVAVEILKPSEKELEHGLQLHADAIVCESYGFAPRTAPDSGAMTEAFESGASESELDDMAENMRLTRCATDPAERAEFEEAFEASGVTCIFQNAGEEGQSVTRMLRRMARYTYVTDALRDFVFKAVTPADIARAKSEGRRCLYLTTCGVPLAGDGASVEDELAYVRIFFQLGARMMHLTYNRRNMIGDGCAEPANGGLSDFGRAAVAEMNRVGVMVDVAHSGWRTCIDAAKASDSPVVASHSGCSALSDHIRCKPDEVIRAICDTGGYIGMCCVPAFLQGSGDISAMLDHIDHAAKAFGADRVAIGTDVAYESRLANAHWERLPARRRGRAALESFWPKDDPIRSPDWRKPSMRLSMAWTNWPLFTVGLVQRGYSDDDIRKIIGGNVLRVARAVLPEGLAEKENP